LPGDAFEWQNVSTVVFEWGDPKAESLFAVMLEHADPPSELYLPFNASTVIEDGLWDLTILDKVFNPTEVYAQPTDYFILPLDKGTAKQALKYYFSLPAPHPELLSRVGQRWVCFGIGTSIKNNQVIEEFEPAESMFEKSSYTSEEVIDYLEHLIDQRDFETESVADLNLFATNITHWVLENFGHTKGRSDEYVLYPSSTEIPGNLLPVPLQPLITHTWKDEVFMNNTSSVQLETKHLYVEEDPFVPNWEHIQEFRSFQQQLNYLRDHPELICGIRLTQVGVFPQVKLRYVHESYAPRWGLQYLINSEAISVAPFGHEGETWAATEYVIDQQYKPRQLAKTICELSVLAARYGEVWSDVMPVNKLISLVRRLRGEESIPLCTVEHQTKPANSMINHLIQKALMRDFE
jgi:hypothetical protein